MTPAVVDVHAGLGWSYDYLATRLGWAGIDGRDGDITAFVHPVNPERVLTAMRECRANATDVFAECGHFILLLAMIDNAAYFYPFPGAVDSTGLLVFGEPFMLPTPLTAVDIVAHEMAHGVTHFTAGLGDTTPPNEPGAIDEAFSDIIGTATEFYVQEPGDGPLRADYLVGEDTGFPIRSLRDPGELLEPITGGPYPDHYDNLFRGREDGGGRPHQRHDTVARLLPCDRGRRQPHLRPRRDGCRPREPPADRADLLQRLGPSGARVRGPRYRGAVSRKVCQRPVRHERRPDASAGGCAARRRNPALIADNADAADNTRPEDPVVHSRGRP